MRKFITHLTIGIVVAIQASTAHAKQDLDAASENVSSMNPLPVRTTQQYIDITGVSLPGEIVGVRNNGVDVGNTEANESGDFTMHVRLSPGANELALTNSKGESLEYLAHSIQYAPLTNSNEIYKTNFPASLQVISPPVLSATEATTEVNPIVVEGYADAGSNIQLFVNGRKVIATQSDKSGYFQTELPLNDGKNTIYASISNNTGVTFISNSIGVEYINAIQRSTSVGGTLTQSDTWTSSGSPYLVTSNLIVPSGVTLTIQSGVEVRFAKSVGLQVSGSLSVQGTAIDPVLLTTDDVSQSINDWTGITILAGATNVTIDNAVIEWAFRGLYFDNSTATVTNSTIANNQYGISVTHNSTPIIDGGNQIINNNYGLFVTSSAATVASTMPVVRANSIYNNVFQNYYTRSTGTSAGMYTLDATGNWWGTTDITQIRNKITDYSTSVDSPVVDFSGFLDGPGGMPAQSGAVLNGILSGQQTLSMDNYLVLGDLNVPVGSSLTLPAGTTLEFAASGLSLEVSGSLVLQGTSGTPVTLTSSQPTLKGRWQGVVLKSGASAQIEHVLIQSAINGIYIDGASTSISESTIELSSNAGVYFLNSATGSIAQSVLRNNRYGVFISHNCSPVINNGNEIHNNDYGIYLSSIASTIANTMPVVNGNSFYSNGFYNYSVRSSGATAGDYELDATGNWWGSADITAVLTKLYDHTDDSTSPFIDSSGFLEAPGGIEALSIYDVSLSKHELHPLLGPDVDIQFILNADSTTQLEIVRESDDYIVYNSQSTLAAGARQLSWDGRDNNTMIVNDGLYRARITISRGAQQVTLDPPVRTLLGSAGVVGSFTPTMNPYRNEPFLLDVSVLEPLLLTMSVSGSDGTPTFNYLTNSFLAPGVQTIYWDGRSPEGAIINGQNYLFFPTPYLARPYVINIIGAKPQLTDPHTAPSVAIKSDPYLITHSYEQFSKVVYSLDQDSVVTFKLLPPGIYDPADVDAITLVNNQLQNAVDGLNQPLDHVVEWRGHSLTDTNQILSSEEGVYTFTIEATSVASGQTTLYRGALQIRQ